MSEALVSDAQKWADKIVMRQYQGPGQMDRAMERASQRTGIDYNVFWSLRYRPPKDILASVYFRLKTAYETELARQSRLYDHDRMLSNAVNSKVLSAADFVAGQEDEREVK